MKFPRISMCGFSLEVLVWFWFYALNVADKRLFQQQIYLGSFRKEKR